MLSLKRYTLIKSEKREFFPKSEKLTSQISKNVQDHAIEIVSSWAKSLYKIKIQKEISKFVSEGIITKEIAKILYTIGKYLLYKPTASISQEYIDTYQLLFEKHKGKDPTISPYLPMRLSEMTSHLDNPEKTKLADFWLNISTLQSRKTIWLPLVGNPYVKDSLEISKGILAYKKRGKWRFDVIENKEYTIPELPDNPDKIAIDVGLNVLATLSNGDMYGKEVKPKFDLLYQKIKKVRGNRQRQGFNENSPRLDCLESRLTGLIKTETGKIVNRLLNKYPNTLFVLEDLDLSGCRGQKRFAYRALQHNLESKAKVMKVNPAYTSQGCPSCGYISKKNRTGIKFECNSCGRKAHADWVGASGILRRSENKNISCVDKPITVKQELRKRYLLRRNSFLTLGLEAAPKPLGQNLTIKVSRLLEVGIGLNSMLN